VLAGSAKQKRADRVLGSATKRLELYPGCTHTGVREREEHSTAGSAEREHQQFEHTDTHRLTHTALNPPCKLTQADTHAQACRGCPAVLWVQQHSSRQAAARTHSFKTATQKHAHA
jgi:hypothetical protein